MIQKFLVVSWHFLYVNVWQLVSMNVKHDVEIDVIVGLEIVKSTVYVFTLMHEYSLKYK